MNRYLKHIDQQIEFNQGKNILQDDSHLSLKFIDETIRAISALGESDTETEEFLIDYTVAKVLEEFCRINQYYTFEKLAINDLKLIYRELFRDIRVRKDVLDKVSKNHYAKLKHWLLKTNSFAGKLYAGTDLIEPVACEEYSAELQVSILGIEPGRLTEPVLDIGCGRQAKLVGYLCKLGIEAYGIDRFSFSTANLINTDWLEYSYGIKKWGTIISNLGFSNHFKHHNLRQDGNYLGYARKYMEILNSLQPGGTFHYAPDLPFVESYLNKTEFRVVKHHIGEFDFKASHLIRLK